MDIIVIYTAGYSDSNLTVTFSGTSPASSVTINGGNSSVTYTPDVQSGMKNGDVITITAESKYSNILLKETEKEYTVDGLSAYAMSLDEIPSETKDKMQQQATDAITASCASWREGSSLNQLDFVGFYFLSNKEGFAQKPYNQLYCVFKASTTVTGLKKGGDGETQETGDEIYYTNYSYSDIMLLSDGICSVDISAGQISSNTIESDYGYRDLITTAYVYKGYTDLDSMFNDCIAKNVGNYNYETTVQ